MSLTVTGLSHHTSPVELRERMAFSPEDLPAALHRFKKAFPEGGVVLLSTCNRVEAYVRASAPPEQIHATVRQLFSELRRLPESDFIESLYEHDDRATVSHCFRVTAALDSLVVGENQILGQVHDAFLAAQTEQTVDKILSTLFQKAFKVAKEIKTKTTISEGKVSVASVAADLAVQIFGDLAGKTIMVIGSGETGELALKSLVAKGASRVIVVNRTLESARELAAAHSGEAAALDDIARHLHRADIVVSSTGAPMPILGAADFQRALRARNKAPMFVIDIAVPRDIAAEVHAMDNIYLYNIDHLQAVANENLEARRAEVDLCMRMVEQQVDQFMRWRQGLFAEPAIVSMSQEFHAIREREVERALAQLRHLNEEDQKAIDYMTKRIVNQILQRPMVQMKEEMSSGDPHGVLHIVRRLFGIEERTS